jgi:hypothetical protein
VPYLVRHLTLGYLELRILEVTAHETDLQAPVDSYQIPLHECDVLDKDLLILYRDKRRSWRDLIFADDSHAIVKQINLMSWSYAVFRVINETRRIAVQSKRPSAALNQMLAEFIDNGFVATQALAIRRLMEPPAKKAERQVVSLRRLVDDVVEHQHVFTREIFIGFNGAPLDPEPGRARSWERERQRLEQAGGAACWFEAYVTSGPDAWEHAERLHQTFDRLTNGGPGKRERTDRIPSHVFQPLRACLSRPAIEKATALCNKLIAHAADPVSRAASIYALDGVTFHQLDDAHRTMITAAEFVAGSLLSDTVANPIAIPQFDLFANLDTSWIDCSALEELNEHWRSISRQRESWVREAENSILSTT